MAWKNERRKKGRNQNPCSLFIISVPDLWFSELRGADYGTAVPEPGMCTLLWSS